MSTDELAVPSTTNWLRPLRWSAPSMMTPARPPSEHDEFALPVGTVTFLLTDVEGSTLGWQSAPELMGPAIARHYEILERAVAANGGVLPQEQGEGDSVVGAFGRASDALKAAVEAQQALAAEPWSEGLLTPIRVRMAMHTGEAQMRNEANYVGQAIIRTARLRAIAHGEQILVSQAARDLAVDQLGAEVEVLDLGMHRLKDLARPEHVWQVVAPGLRREFPPLKSLDAVPNNLPMDLSSFVGRQVEISTVAALVETNQLVIVNGTGGAGKTRLAQQVAAQLSDRFEDGTWWIELAPLHLSDVLGVIAAAVSVKEPDRLVEKLANRTMLLVLDNCEHLLDVIGPLVNSLVRGCPNVRVLATSRGPLDVPGEITWRIPPLGLPDPSVATSIERLGQFDAVRLFVDRARRARPNFELTTDNGPSVAELCARLDGIPLAIELAAARAKSLTAQQILKGLEDSLRLLTGGSRLVMPRQQTLEASIAWSHDLLAETERLLLRRLSVFAGGWDLEAAEAICADERLDAMAVLNGLERLIDQSLVRVEENGATARYQLLETVRQFADRVLTEPVERASIVSAHTAWYQRLAVEIGPLVEGPDDLAAIARLTPERDNIFAALRRLEVLATVDRFVETVLALCPFWHRVGAQADAGVNWMTAALNRLGDEPGIAGARLLTARAWTQLVLGRFGPLITDLHTALALGEQVGDRRTLGRIRTLGGFLTGMRDLPVGVAMLDQAYLDSEAADDRFGADHARCNMAFLYVIVGDHIKAEIAFGAIEALLGQIGNAGLFGLLRTLRSRLCLAAGDHAGAAALLTPDRRDDIPLHEAGRMQFDMLRAADFGEPLPGVDRLLDRLRHFERTHDDRTAVLVRETIVRTRWINDELDEALAFADIAIAAPLGADPFLASLRFESAQIAFALEDFAGARERFEQAGEISSIRLQTTVEARTTVALLARHDGDLARAEDEVNRALTIAVEQMYIREVLRALEMLAGLAAAQGSWLDAARVAGASQRQRDERRLHSRVEPFRSQLEADLAAARAALGDDGFEAAFTEGRGLSLDDVVAYVRRARGERGRPTLGWASLTPTERRVVDLARVGRTNAEIAGELLMGSETVKTHLSRVYAKLGVANRTMLAALNVPPSTD